MKNTIYAVIAACLAMLATSGIVALATAAPSVAGPLDTVEIEQFDAWISDMIDEQYRDAMARRNAR